MKIIVDNNDKNILVDKTDTFRTDLGWQESFAIYEKDVLYEIINPVENYETTRFIHKPYVSQNNILQSDIWFYFYFVDKNGEYTKGLDYSLVGLPTKENAMMTKQATESFFRLEFYKTPNGEAPERANRRLVFAKNLSLPLGEKQFYTVLNDFIYCPVFTGSNYRNKENMYFFWFLDESAFDETTLTGNTFYMTARFLNSVDGSAMDFTNKPLIPGKVTSETNDVYFKVVIDRVNHSYEVFRFDGLVEEKVGTTSNPIKFYERRD